MATDTPAKYQCVECKKTRPGRFTRRRSPGVNTVGWASRGKGLPAWYCWICLPAGQGRDETEESMPAKIPAPIVLIKNQVPTAKMKEEGLAVLTGFQSFVAKLTITNATEYLKADQLLGQVRTARKTWGERMERIIRPMRTALDEVYSLNRDVDKPFEQVETAVKLKMKAFKLEEQRQIQAAENAKILEATRLRLEAEEKEALAAKAKTAQMRGKIAAQQERIQEQIAEVESREAPAPLLASLSSTRSVSTPRVTNILAFCEAIANGTIPHDLIEIRQSALNKQYKDAPEEVSLWPGIEIIEDMQIVGR